MDTVSAIIWLSVALQSMAAAMALRLIPLSGPTTARLVFFLAVFLLMAALYARAYNPAGRPSAS